MPEADVIDWLRARCEEFELDVSGVFRRRGDHAWPFGAIDPLDLEAKLLAGGHLLPLPREPAALANVLEVAIVDHLLAAVEEDETVVARRGSERGYPDLELGGDRFGGGFHAVDVKVARRDDNPVRTRSRITLYTGNTYFRWPQPALARDAPCVRRLRIAPGPARDLQLRSRGTVSGRGAGADRPAVLEDRQQAAILDDTGVHRCRRCDRRPTRRAR